MRPHASPTSPIQSRLLRFAATLAALTVLSPHLSVWVSVRVSVQGSALRAWSQATATSRVDAGQLVADVEKLASADMEGRLTGSAGNQRARAMILERFKQLKLQPVNGSYEQTFAFTGSGHTQSLDAVNLMALIPGTHRDARGTYVLVSAHYDHLGVRNGQTYYGADDDASGVAAILAMASWFAKHPARQSLLFVAFDGEETGLQGSKHFVAHPPVPLAAISVVVNLDMVGRGDTNVLFAVGTRYTPALRAPIEAAAKGRSFMLRFGHDGPGAPGEDWTQSSDHGSFHSAGVPFVYFGVENHRDYHRPTDTADRIPRQFFVDAAETILQTVESLANGAGRAQGARVSPAEQTKRGR